MAITRFPTHCAFVALLLCSFSNLAMGLTNIEITQTINSYNDAFYYEPADGTNVGYYFVQKGYAIPGYQHFWQSCETIEALEDAYQRTNNPTYQGMITKLVNGLNQVVSKDGNPNWASWNEFSDDIMWGVIALARAYELTGKANNGFLDQAEEQFNAVWTRAWDSTLGGGLWQTTKNTSKNACVNFPAVIAAMYLARNKPNTGFRAQADLLWKWSRDHLFNEATGQVSDNVNAAGELSPSIYTYNLGTFIGAAYMLYLDTGNTGFLQDCALAATFAKNNLTTSGILDNHETGGSDGPGFKGIFARWCSKYARSANNEAINQWLTTNANTAWSNRNAANLMGTTWQDRTADGDLASWACSSGLSITQDAP